MRRAVRDVVGEHDFRPYAVRGGAETSGRCRVTRAAWTEWRYGYRFSIEADRFLMRMVRMLVGTMIEVGHGRLPHDAIATELRARAPARRPAAAPAAGLYLAGVRYLDAGWRDERWADERDWGSE